MPILNYTTEVEAARTVGEIQTILAKHGARAVMMEYTTGGNIEALSFMVPVGKQEVYYKLPVKPAAVLRCMERVKVDGRYRNPTQAVRVAWRIIKDWVEAQMAIIETEQVTLEEVFLPYEVTGSGKLLYEVIHEKHLFLPEKGTPDK